MENTNPYLTEQEKIYSISDLVTEITENGVQPDNANRREAMLSNTPATIAQALISIPPKVVLADGRTHALEITFPSQDDLRLSEKPSQGEPDYRSSAYQITAMARYLRMPRIAQNDKNQEWQMRIVDTLDQLDQTENNGLGENTLSETFIALLSDSQLNDRKSNTVLMAFELLNDNILWNEELQQQWQDLFELKRSTYREKTTSIIENKIADSAASLARDALAFLDHQSHAWALSEKHLVGKLAADETLRKLIYRIDFSKQQGHSTSHKDNLGPTARACLEKLGKLASTNPEGILQLISAELPGIAIINEQENIEFLQPNLDRINPTQDEKYAANLVDDPNVTPKQKSHIATIVKFLRAPRIIDGFDDHKKERQRWENAMGSTLSLITDEAKKQLSDDESQNFPQLDVIFNKEWTYNKYTKNSRLKVQSGIQMILYALENNDPRRQQFTELLAEFRAEGLDKQYMEVDEDTDGNPIEVDIDIDEVTDKLSLIAQKAMYILAEKEFPNHQNNDSARIIATNMIQ